MLAIFLLRPITLNIDNNNEIKFIKDVVYKSLFPPSNKTLTCQNFTLQKLNSISTWCKPFGLHPSISKKIDICVNHEFYAVVYSIGNKIIIQ